MPNALEETPKLTFVVNTSGRVWLRFRRAMNMCGLYGLENFLTQRRECFQKIYLSLNKHRHTFYHEIFYTLPRY